jgi:peptide/nickel transport system permease protein
VISHRSKLLVLLVLLACVHIVILFAGFFAPYNFALQNREEPNAPPTHVHFFAANGRFHLGPFVYGVTPPAPGSAEYRENQSVSYPIRFLVPGSAYKIAGLIPSHLHLFGVDSAGAIFLLGSDEFGRDQFSRFLYGGQISLLAGSMAAVLSLSLGAILGALSGYYGGWLDDVLMRFGELFLALPWLYLLFAIRAALPLHIAEWQVFMLLVAVLGLIGWARPARLIRGVILSAREQKFVVAARGFGASDTYLLARHVLPQAYPVVLTQFALLIPQYVLAEVTLTFLGLGVSEPIPSWGTLLSPLQHYSVLSSCWWMFLPALLLVPIFLAYYATADTLQERLKSASL